MTAVVRAVTKVEARDLPVQVNQFLRDVVSEGQFFPPGFLYPFEEQAMQFDV